MENKNSHSRTSSWALSCDGWRYFDSFSSKEEAISAGKSSITLNTFFVGKIRSLAPLARPVIKTWAEKHNLRAKHVCVEDPTEIITATGEENI